MKNPSQYNWYERRLAKRRENFRLAKEGDPVAQAWVESQLAAVARCKKKAREEGRPYTDTPERRAMKNARVKAINAKAKEGNPKAVKERQRLLEADRRRRHALREKRTPEQVEAARQKERLRTEQRRLKRAAEKELA